MGRAVVGLWIVGALAVLPGAVAPAIGQETFDLDILDQGKPQSGVDVLLLVNQGKVDLGTTVADGSLEVDMSLVNLGKGDPVDVYVIECDDVVVVVFVAPGEEEAFEEECERRRRENPECECRKIGTFLWGDDVIIDVGTRTITRAGMDDGPIDGARTGPFTLGVGFSVRQMLELDDVAGMATGVTAVDATSFAPGVQLTTEYGWWDGKVSVGVGAGWSRMDTETRFGDGGVQTGELDYYELGGSVRVGPGDGGFDPFGIVEFMHAWNKIDFELDGAMDHRDHKTWRSGIGAGFDYVSGRVGVRAEALYSTVFEEDDADEHVRWTFGLLYRPFIPRY